MSLLFPYQSDLPEGFLYSENFLSEREEAALIETVSGMELHPLIFQGFEAKRKVESFGYDYNFDKRSITKGKAIPSEFDFLVQKVAAYTGIPAAAFAEILVTEYPPGSVINWHRDAPPFDIVVGISLLTACKFRLRPYDKTKQGRGSIVSLEVKRRSMYILQGISRSEWEHSIAPLDEKRYSITLRTLRNP